ncbi:LacI family DNA-binding transcriptional regulator [Leifsonia xyli]|uniref:LacI family DNA-binding transcriptional regulator n=1 Tax=Leifsonia xyli TaxID=1575 RepID=UPI003D66705D
MVEQGTRSDAGRRRVTAADVARSLGISRATVGFVLNNTPGQTISPATTQRVLEEAKRLGYRPHSAARALASGQSRVVLLVLPDWPLDYSMRSNLDEASFVLDQAGYSLVTMTTHVGGRSRPLWESLSPDAVVGMIPFSESQIADIRAGGVEHIITSSLPEHSASSDLGWLEGPRLQAEHLLQRGSRRIAFAATSDARLSALVDERRRRAEGTLRERTGAGFVDEVAVSEGTAAEVVQRWAAAGVDGVVAYNDDIAAMVTGAAVRAGVSVPDSLAVVGHDDSPLARLFVPSLSSVRIDTAGLGRYLAELALASIASTDPPVAGPESEATLVRRETT